MTGTALTEEQEFRSIYNLDVVAIPTNLPIIRIDHPDVVYKETNGKFNAVIDDIEHSHKKGQPLLVGTISIETSEHLSTLLKRRGIPHNVLNAKYHDKEAEIVAQAGKLGAVTIATNMAGRGTDIMLGGNPEFLAKQEMRKQGLDEFYINMATSFNETDDEQILNARRVYKKLYDKFKIETDAEKKKVIEAGGLKIIGTERHESRRIDNQLRGRSGRQGDPGESRFYISLEDDLMRLFGSDRLTGMIDALGLEDDQPIEHRMLSNAIENAQKKIEGINFNRRKNVLQYDDVMNQQREIIYNERYKVLNGENLKDNFLKMIDNIVDNVINLFCRESPFPENWEWNSIKQYVEDVLLPKGTFNANEFDFETLNVDEFKNILYEKAQKRYNEQEELLAAKS